MTDDEVVPAGTVDDGSAASGTRPGRRPSTAGVVAVVCFLLAVGCAVWAGSERSARQQEVEDRARAADVAGRLAAAMSTYDYRSFDATTERVLDLATGRFRAEYGRNAASLAGLLEPTQATSEATVSDVFVTDVAGGRARAIVVCDVRTTGIDGPRQPFDSYVEVSLVKVAGRWLADDVANRNVGIGSQPRQPTTSSTAG